MSSPQDASPSESGTPTELDLPSALRLAFQMHQARHFDDAELLYRRIIETWPDAPDAWHLLGMLLFQRDRDSEGVAAVRHCIELLPTFPDAHANLGNMLLNLGRISEASHHLHRALILNPSAIPPRVALCSLLRALGRLEAAEAMIRPAVESEDGSQSAAAQNALGNVLESRGEHDAAIDRYRLAQELNPDLGFARARLGMMLAYTGRLSEAAKVFRERLDIAPDDAEAAHMLAACGGAETPSRANDAYVRSTFDAFASSFDAKLESLEYRAPELIHDCMRETLGAPSRQFEMLDAGCGTGLLGVLVRGYCKRLDGVDLSPGMMARARTRGVYDALVEGELAAYLSAHPNAYDVVASADTLCYIGDLAPVFAAASHALRPGGWLFFSVEHGATLERPYLLQFHGRYAHQRQTMEQQLAAAGFAPVEVGTGALRMEMCKPVPGLIVAARKGGG